MHNETTKNEVRNVIIIGSGPSGYTAALYTARANLSPLLIAGNLDPKTMRIKGGQLMYTSDIENFPGAVETPIESVESVKGVAGPDLMKRMEMQARHFGTEMVEEFVTEVSLCAERGGEYSVTTESGTVYKARSIIIATGAAAKTLGISSEEKFYGQGGGVSTCATCDGFSYKNSSAVAVVGGGDSAMEEAAYLANIGIKKVYLLHRREEFRASRIMLKRVQSHPNIEMILNVTVEELLGKPHPLAAISKFYEGQEVVDKAVLRDTKTGETREIEIEGLFVAIGHTPNTGLFKNQLKMDEAGYLERDSHMRAIPSMTCEVPKMRSLEHVPGVFVAGDVSDHVYRQAITAAGMGCMAAIEAERYLAEIMVDEKGLAAGDVDISTESIAQSHWSNERDQMDAKPMLERVEEGAHLEAAPK
jgi:thioredoxin reductase (NADPH)